MKSTVKENTKSVKGQVTSKNEGVQIAPINKENLKLAVQKERQAQKDEATKKAIEFLGVKIVNGKEIKPSAKLVKAQTTVEKFIDKDNRTLNETKLLTNALSKTDCLSASKVYAKMMSNTILNEYFLELSGAKELPSFKDFTQHLPVKFAYSEWDILGALVKMNPKYKLAKKIEAQNKATKAK